MVRGGVGRVDAYSLTEFNDQIFVHEVIFNDVNHHVIVDNRRLTDDSFSSNDFSGNTNTLWLFAAHDENDTATYPCNAKIYWVEAYNTSTDTLLCKLIPCYRVSDGAIGFYDTVNQVFRGNLGSGTLTKGQNIGPRGRPDGNLFNYYAFKNIGIHNGTAVWGDNGSFTLTATADDCYTNYSGYPQAAIIPVKAGQSITMTWEASSASDTALKNTQVYFFKNGSASASNFRYACAIAESMTWDDIPSGTNYITVRFGVQNAGDSITYSNIRITRSDP